MKIWKIVLCSAVVCFLIIGDVLCALNYRVITVALCGTGVTFETEDVERAKKLGDELCSEIAEEGIVLLKNERRTLPLAQNEYKLNIFGWASDDKGFILSGGGSGASTLHSYKKLSLLSALNNAGYKYNEELSGIYENYGNPRSDNFVLTEPDRSVYTDELLGRAKEFSDTALIVISRYGGENIGEIPTFQQKHDGRRDYERTYLQTSAEEDDMIEIVCSNFKKVIVLLNTCNTMHAGFLDDGRIGAALYVGVLGQSGTRAIAGVLSGEISPSGRLSDTYAYEPWYDPSWANRIRQGDHIRYAEDIYIGYKWYETADFMDFFDDVDNEYGKGYEGVVQYPFGYGLSYTSFVWKVTDLNIPRGGGLNYNERIELTLSATNIGNCAGKDVLGVYFTPPYNKGGIEKACVNLVGFAKTETIKPSQTQTGIKIAFDVSDMASYDCYDSNKNGVKGYELEPGPYMIKLMKNAHEEASVAPASDATILYHVETPIIYRIDPTTGNAVENRFTGDSAYAGVPIDGSNVGIEDKYLSRADFKGTFPYAATPLPSESLILKNANDYINDSYSYDAMPVTGQENKLRLVTRHDGNFATAAELGGGTSLKFNAELIVALGSDYDNPQWGPLLDQMSVEEMCNLIKYGGFRTAAVVSIGKPYCYDFDGPAGFNENSQSPVSRGEWTAYPAESLMGCSWNVGLMYNFGMSLGVEANATDINGIYAPCVNLHRTPYTARNYEFYGEDAVLSGKLAANVIAGAKRNGLYCYIKHFALGETGQNAYELNTWLTESNLRETYLKPFEICVKEGGANGFMSALNRVGAVWAGACHPLNVGILREEWGFKGSIITDYTSGDPYMSIAQGLPGGNDLWLNPNNFGSTPIDENDVTTMNLVRNAVKNILFTYANTYGYAMSYDGASEDKYNVSIGVFERIKVFPWWVPIWIFINLTVIGAVAYTVFKAFAKPKHKSH